MARSGAWARRVAFEVGDCPRDLENAILGMERPSLWMAVSSGFSPSAEINQCLRIGFGGISVFA
jgi:hypothetical protein